MRTAIVLLIVITTLAVAPPARAQSQMQMPLLAPSAAASPEVLPPSPDAGAATEIPSVANCKLSADDVAAGKRAYCGYLSRLNLYHQNEMDRFVAQLQSERHLTDECAKEAVEEGQKYYMANVMLIANECYGMKTSTFPMPR
jgi:hypothetical protein